MVLCLIALVAWWRWHTAPLPVKPPALPANSLQAARAPSPPTGDPTDDSPPKPKSASVDPAVLQVLAQELALQQQEANGPVAQLPPGAQLTDPIEPGRPTVAGQTFIAEQSKANGEIAIAHDKLIGFMPVGVGQYKAIWDADSRTATPEVAASLKKKYEAESSSVTSVPIDSDPIISALISMAMSD